MPEVIPPRAFDAAAVTPIGDANTSGEDVSTATAAGADAAGTAESAENLGRFISRRESLGRPSAIVPSPNPAADALANPADSVRPAAAGNWYKLAAGALFLASLGLIGYRHNQRQRDRRTSVGVRAGGGGNGRDADAWQPRKDERRPRVRGNTEWREPEPAPAYASGFRDTRGARDAYSARGAFRDDDLYGSAGASSVLDTGNARDAYSVRDAGIPWEEEPIARQTAHERLRDAEATVSGNDRAVRFAESEARDDYEDELASEQPSRRRSAARETAPRESAPRRRARAPLGEKVASTSFVFETRSPGAEPERRFSDAAERRASLGAEPSEIGYHDEIERRVRRMAADRDLEEENEAVRPRRRRPSMREGEYERIAEMAAGGRSARQIARELQVPVGEVEAVLNIRARGARPASPREDFAS
jgi:hypothetical protein